MAGFARLWKQSEATTEEQSSCRENNISILKEQHLNKIEDVSLESWSAALHGLYSCFTRLPFSLSRVTEARSALFLHHSESGYNINIILHECMRYKELSQQDLACSTTPASYPLVQTLRDFEEYNLSRTKRNIQFLEVAISYPEYSGFIPRSAYPIQ